jgi:hypothetical protein
MATREEMREALNDYVAQASKSERVLKALRSWNCIIFLLLVIGTAMITAVMRLLIILQGLFCSANQVNIVDKGHALTSAA